MVPTMANPSMVTGVRGASETSRTAPRSASQTSCRGERRRLGRAAHHRARGGHGEAGRVLDHGDVVRSRLAQCLGSSRSRRVTRRPPGAARCSWTAAWSLM
jgi:hypothetical protein